MRNPLNSIVTLTKHIHKNLEKLNKIIKGTVSNEEFKKIKEESIKIIHEISKSQF